MSLHRTPSDVRRLMLMITATFIIVLSALPLPCAAERGTRPGKPVGSIRFAGNETFSDRHLLKWMQLQPQRLFRREYFTQEALEGDLVNILRFYRSEGFLQATVEGSADADRPWKRDVSIAIRVREGPRWTVTELHMIAGADSGPGLLDSLPAVPLLRPSSPYRVRGLVEDRNRLYEALAGMGYLDASVGVEVMFPPISHSASVRYTISQGDRAYLRDVRIRGLYKTRQFVVEREIGLPTGHPLRPRDAGEIRASLLRTGLFRTVRVVPDPADWGRSSKSLLVEVEETPPGAASLGLGYGSSDRLRLLVSVDQRNFRGHAVRAGLRGVLGERRRVLEGELATPWTLGHRLVTHVSSAYSYHRQRSYEAERVRGGVALKRPLGFFWSTDLAYKAERVALLRSRAAGYGPEAIRLGTLASGVTRDTRDDLDQPSSGGYLRVTQAWTGPWLGSRNNYATTEIRRLCFLSAGPVVFAGRVDFGLHQPQGSRRPVPLSERYFAGGFHTLRGFPEEGIGPADGAGHPLGGRVRVLGSLEARIPVYRKITAALYADAGQVSDHFEGLAISRISLGAGGGIRLRSPVGRVRADVAFPLTARFADGPQLYIGTGGAF